MVSPNGKRVYASTPAGIAVYSTSSWWSTSAKLLGGTTGSTVLAVGRDSASVYTVTGGSQIKVLSATNFTVLNEFTAAEHTTNAAVNKDGSLLFPRRRRR